MAYTNEGVPLQGVVWNNTSSEIQGARYDFAGGDIVAPVAVAQLPAGTLIIIYAVQGNLTITLTDAEGNTAPAPKVGDFLEKDLFIQAQSADGNPATLAIAYQPPRPKA